MYQSRQN